MSDGIGPEAGFLPPPSSSTDPIKLYTEGDDLYDTMGRAIAGADHHIALASYIFAADAVGEPLLTALLAKARQGVAVRIQVDAIGTAGLLPNHWRRRLRESGVQLRSFHPWRWRHPLRYNHRDHRKLLVVDGRQAFLGGFNIHRQGSRRHFGPARWRDTHVQVGGELAAQAGALFDAFWAGDLNWAPVVSVRRTAQIIPNTSHHCRRVLRCTYLDAIGAASQRAWLTTPYFLPDRRLRRALGQAARRGVDVRVLTTRITDAPPVRWAARAIYPELLAAGIRIYEYLPRLLHAKTVLIDEQWSSVGTANLDYRSLFANYELVLLCHASWLSHALEQQFLRDLQDADALVGKPAGPARLLDRVVTGLGYRLRRWL